MTNASAALEDTVAKSESENSTVLNEVSETSDTPLKKMTLAEGEAVEVPEMSFSAGSLRGQMNSSGLRVENVGKTASDDPLSDEAVNEAYESVLHASQPVHMIEEDGFLSARPVQLKELEMPAWVNKAQMAAMIASGVWVGLSLLGLVFGMGGRIFTLMPHEFGGIIAGMLAPVALLWLALTHITRTHDAQRYGEALRAELHALIFPSEDRQQRISHDIEKLCQQAAELSTASRTVLKAIQKSRQALQNEARDFALLSRKAEVHIDRLAENLHERASKLVSITDEIEQRTNNIDAKTKEGAAAWDETAKHILGKASEIEESLGRGADKILGAAEKAQAKTTEIESQMSSAFDSLSGSIDQVAERLSGLSSEFDTHGDNLSRATERVVDETSRLGGIIQTQIQDLEGMASGVFEAVAKSSEMIKEQRATLDQSAEGIAHQANEIAGKIRNSAMYLDETSQLITSRTDDVEVRMTRQADMMRTVLADLDAQTRTVEQTGSTLSNRLSDALSVALSGSDTLGATVRRAVESLEKAAADTRSQATDIIKSTMSGVEELQGASSAQLARVQSIFAQLGESREQLIDGARRAEDQAKAVLKMYEDQTVAVGLAVTTLTEKLMTASTGLEQPLKAVDLAVSEADRRHEMIDQTLVRRVEDLNKSSEKARETAEQIQSLLRTQAQDMSILSGQIAGQVRSIGEQIGQQKDALSGHAERAVRDLENVGSTLQRQAEALQTVATGMNADITRLHDRVIEKAGILRSESEQITDKLRAVDGQIDASASRFVDQTNRLRDASEMATASLDSSVEHAEPVYRRAIEQAASAQDRMEQMNRTFEQTSSSNLERLQQIGGIFDDRLSQLRTGVQEAAQVLRDSGDELRMRVDDIENATMSSSERMNSVSKTLNNQITDIHLLTDQALLKVEAVQQAIEGQFHELNAAVGKAVSELETAQNGFTDAARTVDSSAEASVRKLQGASRDTVGECNILQGAAAAVVKTTQDMVANLQLETKTMLQSANEALMEVKKIGDSFALRAREVEEHMKSSLNTSQAYGRDLKDQAGAIAESSIDTTEKISKSVSLLNAKIVEVEKAAMSVGEKVEQVRGKLDSETSRFMSTAKQAIDAAEEASSSYVRQSSVLFKAAQDASAQVDKIRDVHWRTQRDTFLSSAKFVIESLHSLSVDFVRVLEGEVQDKTFKAFQKGDVAAFTRRLVANAEAMPLEKIRTKFTADSEFRSYVQRFIRLFEELFDQAILNDHGELLAATFLSSDIGKLYQMLCTATGREAKAGRDLARAA